MYSIVILMLCPGHTVMIQHSTQFSTAFAQFEFANYINKCKLSTAKLSHLFQTTRIERNYDAVLFQTAFRINSVCTDSVESWISFWVTLVWPMLLSHSLNSLGYADHSPQKLRYTCRSCGNLRWLQVTLKGISHSLMWLVAFLVHQGLCWYSLVLPTFLSSTLLLSSWKACAKLGILSETCN